MTEVVWEGFLDSITGEEKLLKLSNYEVEVADARPMVKGGEVQRGIFVDLVVTKGPEKGASASVYIGIPEPGNRRQGFWYAKKMAGFGDMKAIYESMPPDLEGGLQVLCASIIGRKIIAQIGPGQGDYSNRNSLIETRPLGVPATTVSKTEEEEIAVEETSDDGPGF